MRYVAIILICSLLILPYVTSLGVSPPRATIEFSPYQEGGFDVLLNNGRNKAIGTSVEISGELAPYFSAEAPDINARGSSRAEVTYSLPEDITPGENQVQIKWTEEFFDEQQGAVAAKVAIIGTYTVWKPYPGRYAEISLRPRNVAQGENTDVQVRIDSKGDQPVRGEMRLRVFSAEGTLQDTITEHVEIPGNDHFQKHRRILSANYEPGKYRIEVRYDYGSGVAEQETTFIIGKQSVDILSVTPKEIYKDKELTRFDIVIESLWNEPLQGVSAQLTLGSETAQTPSTTITAFDKKTLTGYWETDQNIELGEVLATIEASFIGGESVQKTFPITVYNETPQPQEQQPTTVISLTDILFAISMLAIIGYVFTVVMRRHQ